VVRDWLREFKRGGSFMPGHVASHATAYQVGKRKRERERERERERGRRKEEGSTINDFENFVFW
jgi:hypothetical protein